MSGRRSRELGNAVGCAGNPGWKVVLKPASLRPIDRGKGRQWIFSDSWFSVRARASFATERTVVGVIESQWALTLFTSKCKRISRGDKRGPLDSLLVNKARG